MTRYNMQRNLCYAILFIIGQFFLSCNPDDLQELEKNGYIILSPSSEFDELLYENISVTIYNSDSIVVIFYESINAAPEQIELPIGDYYIVVKSNSLLEAVLGVEVFLETDVFTVGEDAIITISLPMEAVEIIPEDGIPPMRTFELAVGSSGSDVALDGIEKSTGGYLAVGYSSVANNDVSSNNGGNDFWIVSLDFDGALEWEVSYGGISTEQANSVVEALDGSGFVVAGFSRSSNGDVSSNYGSDDYWVIKIDNEGNLLWEKNYGGSSRDRAEEIFATKDGGYILNGRTQSTNFDVSGFNGGNDFWILKIDGNGNIQWQHPIGGTNNELGYGVIQTKDGGYAAVGYSSSTNGDVTTNKGGVDYWVVKLSSSGTIEWEKSLGGSSNDVAYAISETSNGELVVGGYTLSFNNGDVSGHNGGFDYWAVKLDANGNLIWQHPLGGSSFDIGLDLIVDDNDRILMNGYSLSNNGDKINPTYGGWDYWVVNLDTDGSLLWERSYGGTSTDIGYSIFQARDRGYFLCGYASNATGLVTANKGGTDFWMVKIDTEGEFLD